MGKEPDKGDAKLVMELERAVEDRALLRRQHIEKRLADGEFREREVEVGLKAFHRICDRWAIGRNDAQMILFGCEVSRVDRTRLIEQISYSLRIYRLLHEVVQGDDVRHQRWIRRSIVALDGERPIDLIATGPTGSAKVMEYLECLKTM